MIKLVSAFVVCLLLAATPLFASELQLVSAKKIWHGGNHNAFTDLIYFKGQFLCTFRESQAHIGGNGKIRIISSPNGESWKSAALIAEDAVDLRDPKLSLMPDGRLLLLCGGSVYEGRKLIERQPRVAFSKDAAQWSTPQRILSKGDWLWRLTWHGPNAYGMCYYTEGTATNQPHAGMIIRLVRTSDGLSYETVANPGVAGSPNESTLRFQDNGDCVGLVRREVADKEAWIGTSAAPYTKWKWHSAGMQIGGPNFLILPDKTMIASGRKYPEAGKQTAHTFVGPMTLDSVKPAMILPSGGDCSYPGMVWRDGKLWLSYYSSHEGSTDVYFAVLKPSPHP